MDEDGLRAPSLNFFADLRDVVQGLPAKSASKVTQEDQQGGRCIGKLKQRSTRFCLKLTEGRGDIRFLNGLRDSSHHSVDLIRDCDCRTITQFLRRSPAFNRFCYIEGAKVCHLNRYYKAHYRFRSVAPNCSHLMMSSTW